MTDGLATREYFLEKSGHVALPLKGEGFFILFRMGSSECSQVHIVGMEAIPARVEGSPILSTKIPTADLSGAYLGTISVAAEGLCAVSLL